MTQAGTSPEELDPLREKSMGLMDVAALACLMAGAPVAEPSRRRSLRPSAPREHFIPPEPISKRKARRLRGKAKRND